MKQKKFYYLAALFAALLSGMLALAVTGCASAPQTQGTRLVQIISNANADSVKISRLTDTAYLGFINPGGTTYPSIADTAKAGGITKIATVEYYSRSGILWLWIDYTTIVTGQ